MIAISICYFVSYWGYLGRLRRGSTMEKVPREVSANFAFFVAYLFCGTGVTMMPRFPDVIFAPDFHPFAPFFSISSILG